MKSCKIIFIMLFLAFFVVSCANIDKEKQLVATNYAKKKQDKAANNAETDFETKNLKKRYLKLVTTKLSINITEALEQNDKLVTEKGFMGYVVNHSKKWVTIRIFGNENRSFRLEPNTYTNKSRYNAKAVYLTPGIYCATLRRQGQSTETLLGYFEVNGELKLYGDNYCFWFAYAD
ncbi:MAG: hypothetical protein ABIE43_01360 [Patescibacteria group bacterium]